jgi:phosphate starvation-inducible PhoH-like protein
VLRGIEGISFVQFDDRDVVRHNLVQKIVKAYERYNEVIGANRQMSLKLTDGVKVSEAAPRDAVPEPVTPSATPSNTAA